jgi:AcrR family transcriptional regulator
MALRSAPVVAPDTPARILDAVFGCVSNVGLARTTVEDVARAAGLSRQTIYRYFPSKDHLVLALVLREEEQFLDGVRSAFAAEGGLREALERGILFCLRFAREHPLLDRLLATDQETLLPYLTTRGAPVIARARDVLTSSIRRKAWVRAALVEGAADLLVRAIVSHVLSPEDRPPEEIARDFATIVTSALTGDHEPAGRTAP